MVHSESPPTGPVTRDLTAPAKKSGPHQTNKSFLFLFFKKESASF
jgi:hypothetical protein